MAMWENKVIFNSFFWNINPFDQWGVDLGKTNTKSELDKFCDAMIAIKKEIVEIESGKMPQEDNVLVNAPHTVYDICDDWNHPYSKENAVFPSEWNKENKFWPYVSRIDNAFGDRNFFCF